MRPISSVMNPYAHFVDQMLHLLQPLLIVTAIAGWVLAVVGQIQAHRARKPGDPRQVSIKFLMGVFIFGGIIGGEFLVSAYLKSAALDEVKPKLNAEIEALTVDGRPVTTDDELLTALKGLRDAPAHHSHPTQCYSVVLTTAKGPLELQLGRDSSNTHEFWVFYPGFFATKSSEIGRVFTASLDGL